MRTRFPAWTIAATAALLLLTTPSTVLASFTSTVAGSTASMVGDASGDQLIITQSGGTFRHNRFPADPGFASDQDFDSSAAGDQTIASDTGVINIDAGDGNDTIAIGDGVDLRGAVSGGPGNDVIDFGGRSSPVRANLGLNVLGMAATLAGTQEVPPTTTAAQGTVTISAYNPATGTFNISVTVTDLAPANVNGFHIHRNPVGVNGAIIVDLTTLGIPLVPTGTGFTFSATGVSLPVVHEAAFLGGVTYLNVHSTAFPAGEIRGQLFSTGNVNLSSGAATGMASLASVETVVGSPGSDSLVGGFAANTISAGLGDDTLLGAPGADVFDGGPGSDIMIWSNGDGTDVMEGGPDGDLVIVNGNVTNGDTFTISANGSRVDFDRIITGPFSLDIGTTETLAVNGIGGGDAVTINNLAGVASLATLNVNGFDGDDLVAYGAAVSGTQALVLNGGDGNDQIDLSAATTDVRVNLGLGTTGLTATLAGNQEVPPTSSAASGTATITNYNLDSRTFSISVNVTGLPPADVTGFHIHQGLVGANGPIIIDLPPLAALVPSGDGFTFTANGVTVPSGSEAALLGGGTYVNVHTAAFPGGAIRGQLFSSGNVSSTTGAATGAISVSGFENLLGGSGNDSLVGNGATNFIGGGSGSDWIIGGPGSDDLNGGPAADVLVWSNGDGTDVMDGDEDSDAIVVNGSTSANDVVLVSANGARLNFTRTSPGPFGLDIGTAESLVVNGIGGNDSLTLNDLTGVASVTSVFLHGFDGDDSFSVVQPSAGSLQFSVNGHGGTDSLQGPNAASAWTLPAVDPGTITGLIGFRSIETLLGGTGADTFDLHGRASLLTVNGGTANDTLLYHAESRAVTGDTTPPDGVINSPGVQPIAFSQIEAVTILDPQPTMTIDDVTRGEGSSLPNATFTVTLSNASLLTVTVNYATADGTAAAPGDYASQSGVLTFAPGATTQTIAVPINVDTLVEGSETFFVNLSGAVNAGLADAQGQGTITDNAVPTITAIPNQTLAFGAATGALPFTVGDVETAAAFLIVTATSSNPTLVPVGNIGFGGGVANRTVTVTPAAAQVGTSAITLTVTDIGGASASTTFNVTVNQPTTVQPPTNLYVSAMAGNQVTFRFTPAPIGPPATGFALEGGLTAGQVLASLPTGSDAPIFSYPVPSGSFYVRIVATRGAERSAPSNEIRIHVNVPVAPSAPDLFTSAVNGNNLLLSWRNTFGGGAATGLMLDVSGAYTLQVPLGLAETFAVSGVPPGSYSLRLQALNAGGSSPATSPVTFAIPSPCQGSPQLPTNVLFYRIGNNAYLVWEPPSSGPAADRYTINVTGSFTATFQTTARSASGQVGPGSYTITLAAVNACGTSAPTLPQTLVVP